MYVHSSLGIDTYMFVCVFIDSCLAIKVNLLAIGRGWVITK